MRAPIKVTSMLVLAGALGVGGSAGLAAAAPATGQSTPTAANPPTTASFRFGATLGGGSTSHPVPALPAVQITGSGQLDPTHHAASLTVDLPASLRDPMPGAKATNGVPRTLHVVVESGTVYVNFTGLAALDGGKPWISLEPPASVASKLTGALTKVSTALVNVSSILRFATSHGATVSSLGKSTVGGIAVTGSKIVASIPARGTQPLSAGEHPGAELPGAIVSARVWADGHDRLVRGTVSVARTSTPVAAVGPSAFVDVSGYGAPVKIVAPPPAQTLAVPWSRLGGLLKSHGQAPGHPAHGGSLAPLLRRLATHVASA